MGYYNQTNYPDIFKNTYWGMFSGTAKLNIIQNRNTFISDFSIVNVKKSPEYISKIYDLIGNKDHNETYYTKDKNYILVSSPYATDETEFLKNGWTKYLNLYSDSATTWYKIVPFKNKYSLHDETILK